MSPQETARAILAWYGGDASRWQQRGALNIYTADCLCLMNVVGHLEVHGRITGADFNAFKDTARRALGVESVAEWNDAPERAFADVVTLLERIVAEPTL